MVTVHGYASPAQAEFFESTGLPVPFGQEQTLQFIYEAEDFVAFSPSFYKCKHRNHVTTQLVMWHFDISTYVCMHI